MEEGGRDGKEEPIHGGADHRRLKSMVADLSLDLQAAKPVIGKKW
jgi:hypothetical protein